MATFNELHRRLTRVEHEVFGDEPSVAGEPREGLVVPDVLSSLLEKLKADNETALTDLQAQKQALQDYQAKTNEQLAAIKASVDALAAAAPPSAPPPKA